MAKVDLTEFVERHFKEGFSGTEILSYTPERFQREIDNIFGNAVTVPVFHDGYAPFCKLVYVDNFASAKVGVMKITADNMDDLKSGYSARTKEELPVLSRWFDCSVLKVPTAEYLCLILYDKEQMEKEGTPVDGDYGIVSINGVMNPEEAPMPPITMMRNALGIEEGGSDVALNKEAYKKSVEYWSNHAVVK